MRKPKVNFKKIPIVVDLPGESFPGTAVVELLGDRRVLIEGHIGITGYGSTEISVRMRYGQLKICGTNLEVVTMSKEQLVITGSIGCVSILKGC